MKRYVRLFAVSMRSFALLVTAAMFFVSCSDIGPNVFHVDIVDPLDGGIDIEMLQMPRGTLFMGSSLDPLYRVINVPGFPPDTVYNWERPVHAVTVSAFKISVHEITQEQYRAVMGQNPSRFSGFSNMPVENVSWYDAAAFCNQLSAITGLDPCYDNMTMECDYTKNGFRLPTEAEWEYAARAGSEMEYVFSDEQADLSLFANYAGTESLGSTRAVGEKMPNQAGLYDMQGNVYEWCNDFYGRYGCSSETDPRGPDIGFMRVAKGGSWASTIRDIRPGARRAYSPEARNSTIGFRLVRR